MYSLLINVNYQINNLENALVEVNSFLSDSVQEHLNSSCGVIREIIRLNEKTLKRITCNLNDVEFLSRSLNNLLHNIEKN